MASKTRIFRTDVKLDGNTIVAAWDPHNGFGDVSVKDVFLSKLDDVDFNGKKMRNLVIPKIGWTTVYKTEDGYYAVDADAEFAAKYPPIDVEEFLDKWDDFLLSKGYSYVGDDGKDVHGPVITYSKPQDRVMPVVFLYKNDIEKATKPRKLREYAAAYTLRYDKYSSTSDVRELARYKNAKGDLRKALEDAIDARKDDDENFNSIVWVTNDGDSRDPETVFKNLYGSCVWWIEP